MLLLFLITSIAALLLPDIAIVWNSHPKDLQPVLAVGLLKHPLMILGIIWQPYQSIIFFSVSVILYRPILFLLYTVFMLVYIILEMY